MKKRTLTELGFAFALILFSASFLAAAEYSNEISNDFVISNEKASLVKSTELIYNPNYLIGILIILILAIVILVFKKKRRKKNITKR